MPSPSRPTPKRSFPRGQAIMLAVLLVGVAGWGIVSRLSAEARLTRHSGELLIPTVQVITPAAGNGEESLVLPGTVQPLIEAPIYARTSGYVKEWHTDIGTPVKKGQLLAELETPEVDQQLRQAEADFATAQANDALAQSTAVRWKALLATDSVSRQDNDEKQADAAAKHAALASAQANLARLRELESFKRVVAPFDGVVTARQTDIGALINSGAGNGASLFRVADTSRLRIYVQVPESSAPLIHPGVKAKLTVAVQPGRSFDAEVVRTADAIDTASRTLLVEIQADNRKHEILSGGYAQVHFRLPIAAGRPRVPVSALIFRSAGLQLAVVDATGHAHLKSVGLGRDFGTQVEVLSGLESGEQVINSPPDSLSEGDQVRVAAAAAKAAP
jgi:RND family efflux transporter MFP subunit